MTVGDMLRGGVRLVRTQPRALALWALLYFVAVGAMLALLWPMMTRMAGVQQQMLAAGAGAAPAGAPDAMAGVLGGVFLMDLVLLVVVVAIFAAAVRATARGGDDRFGFLRVGMDELRLIGLGLLLWLILTVAIIVFAIVAALIAGGLAAAVGADAGAAVIVVLWIAAMLLLLWAEVRLSLAGALTVLRGRIRIGAAWRATRGRFWTLLGGYLVIGTVYLLVSLILTAILFPGLFGLYAAMLRRDDPAALIAAQQAMVATMFGPRMLVAMVAGTIVNTALIGWLFGAVATAAVALDTEARA